MADDWMDISHVATTEVTAIPTDLRARVALVEGCWARLTIAQRTFLTAWRQNRYNARAATRQLYGRNHTNSAHTNWANEPDYATVMKVWRAMAAEEILNKDRLLARHEDIIETLLTPKPVLHQGIPVLHDGVILEEVEAAAAAKANEALLDRVMPKPRADVEVNVGVAFTPPFVEVVRSAGTTATAIDAEVVEVSPVLPEEDSNAPQGSGD